MKNPSRSPTTPMAMLLALLLALFFPSVAVAKLTSPPDAKEGAFSASSATDRLEVMEKTLATAPEAELSKILAEVQTLADNAQACVDALGIELKTIERRLQSIGTAQEGESDELARDRKALNTNKTAVDSRLAGCRLALVRAAEAQKMIKARQTELLADRLMARGPNLLSLFDHSLTDLVATLFHARGFVRSSVPASLLHLDGWLSLLLASALGLGLAQFLRRRLKPILLDTSAPRGPLTLAAMSGLAHYLPLLGLLAGASVYVRTAVSPEQPPLLSVLGLGLLTLFAGFTALDATLSPRPPAQHYLSLELAPARAISRNLKGLAILVLLGFVVFGTGLLTQLPPYATHWIRVLYGVLLIPNLIRLSFLILDQTNFANRRLFSLLMSAALLSSLVAEWLGFRNLSAFLFVGVTGTLLGLGVFMVAGRALEQFFNGFDEGLLPWQRNLRSRIGLKHGEYMPGLVWLRFLAALLLWSALIVWLLRSWGMSDTGLTLISQYLFDGFTVGQLTVVPSRIVWAILIFALLLAATRWFKKILEQSWLKHVRMDRGAREALVTTTGYVGIILAVLVTLSVAGIEMTNLAIIAGALSVGIGFGLQNVVNNFVSGLILLIERPIKSGDWVVVGATEGYVRRISIRSTRIETFDRADIIVPNSELISGQVTNWMLQDVMGRVKVPVGVAYGSDTERVKEIMLQVARDHPLVITDGKKVSEPRVMFLAFGDSSLNFELRCFIRNVEKRLSVLSDLNFAIDAAFRREGISIPFPQRDVHHISMPEPRTPP